MLSGDAGIPMSIGVGSVISQVWRPMSLMALKTPYKRLVLNLALPNFMLIIIVLPYIVVRPAKNPLPSQIFIE